MSARYSPASKAELRTALSKDDVVTNRMNLIQKFESQIKLALPKHLTPSRMTRIIMTEVRKTPDLAKCDEVSFLGAVIQCAQLGLEPGAGLGQVYLIPFWNGQKSRHEVQFIVGYAGMIDLCERDGRVTVEAHIVREKDQFELNLGTESSIVHKPYTGFDDPGQIIGSYALARYKDGRYKFRFLSKREIEKARESSQTGSKDKGPWKTHYEEMARKTAIRRLFKMLPKSPEMARVQELEDKAEIGESQQLGSVYKEFVEEKNITPATEATIEEESLTVFDPKNEDDLDWLKTQCIERQISNETKGMLLDRLTGLTLEECLLVLEEEQKNL